MNITKHLINSSFHRWFLFILVVLILNLGCENKNSDISRILLNDISNEIFNDNRTCNYIIEEKHSIVLKGQRETFINNLMPIASTKISNELYDNISNSFHYNKKWKAGDLTNTFIISKDKVDKINDLVFYKSRVWLDDQLPCDDFSFPIDSSNLGDSYTDYKTNEIVYDTIDYYKVIKIPDVQIRFISDPIFSDDKNYAIVSFGQLSASWGENGQTVICKKKVDVWEIIMIVNEWGLL